MWHIFSRNIGHFAGFWLITFIFISYWLLLIRNWSGTNFDYPLARHGATEQVESIKLKFYGKKLSKWIKNNSIRYFFESVIYRDVSCSFEIRTPKNSKMPTCNANEPFTFKFNFLYHLHTPIPNKLLYQNMPAFKTDA